MLLFGKVVLRVIPNATYANAKRLLDVAILTPDGFILNERRPDDFITPRKPPTVVIMAPPRLA